MTTLPTGSVLSNSVVCGLSVSVPVAEPVLVLGTFAVLRFAVLRFVVFAPPVFVASAVVGVAVGPAVADAALVLVAAVKEY